MLAMIPLGIPPVESVRPIPMPRSPVRMMAVELRLVGAGGFASVLGANVLIGSSRKFDPDVIRTVGVSGAGAGILGPIGITLWLAEIRLAIPPTAELDGVASPPAI